MMIEITWEILTLSIFILHKLIYPFYCKNIMIIIPLFEMHFLWKGFDHWRLWYFLNCHGLGISLSMLVISTFFMTLAVHIKSSVFSWSSIKQHSVLKKLSFDVLKFNSPHHLVLNCKKINNTVFFFSYHDASETKVVKIS